MQKLIFCALILQLAVPGAALLAEDLLLAGAATADLTPGAGVSLDGPISKPGPVSSVHDRLTSRALVLKLQDCVLLISINDMCMIDREVYDEAKALVLMETGIPVSHQLMAATHTHAAPRVARISTRPPDEAYRKLVARRIADAAVLAYHNLAPARIGIGTFAMPGLAACRRSLCKEGTVGANPFGETGERVKSVSGPGGQVLKPAGKVDHEFSFVSVQHSDGTPLAVLGNFSVHYCGGYERGSVSADYFGYYAHHLESQFEPDASHPPFVGIMSNATSGDVGSFRRLDATDGKPGPWSRMQYFGRLLAKRTIRELEKVQYSSPETLAVETSEISLRVRKPDAMRLDWARNLLSAIDEKGAHPWSRIYARETLHLAAYPDRYSIPLQSFRIGNVAVAAAPCEIFSATGLSIKHGSPFEHTINIELANGYSGYLPPRQQHEWGGYETWPARSSHLEVDAEEKIRLELLRQLARLHGQPTSE